MRERTGELGQATNEYVALLAVVGLVLVGAAGLTVSGLGAQLIRGIQRGICAVAPGPCPTLVAARDELGACDVERGTRREGTSLTLGVLRLAGGESLATRRRSDGRVVVTLAEDSEAGAEVGVGARLAVGRGSASAAGTARGGVRWVSGRSWTLPSEDAAEAFLARYGGKITTAGQLKDGVRSYCSLLCDAVGWNPHAELPEPDETYLDGGPAGEASAALGGGAALSAGLAAVLGRKRTREGATTWYLQLSGEAAGSLERAGALDGRRRGGAGDGAGAAPDEREAGRALSAGFGGEAGGEAVLEYERDASGRPVRLTVTRAWTSAVRASLGLEAAGDEGAYEMGGEEGLIEREVSLDLGDPASRAVAEAFVDALGRPSALPARGRELAERIEQHGRVELRRYELDRDALEYGARMALGIAVGGGWDTQSSGLRLVSVETRLPGMPFLPRTDCLEGTA